MFEWNLKMPSPLKIPNVSYIWKTAICTRKSICWPILLCLSSNAVENSLAASINRKTIWMGSGPSNHTIFIPDPVLTIFLKQCWTFVLIHTGRKAMSRWTCSWHPSSAIGYFPHTGSTFRLWEAGLNSKTSKLFGSLQRKSKGYKLQEHTRTKILRTNLWT